jgi:drug/metabolite transporter (DMT)-like permease
MNLPPTPPPKDNPPLGMALAVAAFFCFSVMGAFAKALSEAHSPLEVTFYRNLLATLPFLIMIFVMGKREILVIRDKPKMIFIRSVFGTMAMMVTFWAISLMPLADASAFFFTSSLFIPILGLIFLKEQVGRWRWGAVVAGFAGVLIMLQPTGTVSLTGAALALTAAFMHAIVYVILRYLGKSEKPETVTFYFMMIGTIISALPLPFVAQTPTPQEIPLLFGVGLAGAAAQFLLSTSFKYAPAAVISVFNYSSIIWSTLLGWMIWNDWPAITVWIGGGIVIASNLLIAWRESRKGVATDTKATSRI